MNRLRLMIAVAITAASFSTLAAEPAYLRDGLLVDPFGRTLYVWDQDPPNASLCNSGCATVWPPLAAPIDAHARGDFSVIVRDDGSYQWAYRGKPLYRLTLDEKRGDAFGDQFGPGWHTVPSREALPPRVHGDARPCCEARRSR
jgi:predicted lipoprotein with Yx(FWY)xxD motif